MGEALPAFAATDASGRRVDAAQLRGSVVVMTFVSLRPGPSSARSAEVIERLAEARNTFPDRRSLRILAVVLDGAAGSDAARLLPAGVESLVGPPEALEDLAAHFGVTVFHEPDGAVHASETAIISADGIVREIWPGISRWTLVDLLEAIARYTPR